MFSKIFEKLIYSRIYDFLVHNNLLYSKQYGFRSSYSTNHALVSITEKIKTLLDSGYFVCGIFIDLEKAFDTVNHEILCDKLNYYGLRGKVNDLIKSYLSNRKQYVSINGFDSEVRDIVCGVPQGSSLGPLLFLIYINDFHFCLNESSSGHFADDTYMLYGSKSLQTIETVMNTELKLVSNWLRLNKLSLNADKTELIIFRSKRHHLDHDITIKLDDINLEQKDSAKYLGIYLDKHLSWDIHINYLSKKLSRANGILSKLRHNAPRKVCINVYYAIFNSYLTYGCGIWGLTAEKNLKQIEILQKKCMRIITSSDYDSHSNPLFIDLKILKVRELIKLQQLKLAYEYWNGIIPNDLKSLFHSSKDTHSTNLVLKSNSKNCLSLPSVKTLHSGSRSVRYQCASLWNYFMTSKILLDEKTCLDMTKIFNFHQFKNKVKEHFSFMYTLD